jgi:hypothetical protein
VRIRLTVGLKFGYINMVISFLMFPCLFPLAFIKMSIFVSSAWKLMVIRNKSKHALFDLLNPEYFPDIKYNT